MDFDSSRPTPGDLAAVLADPALAASLAQDGAIFIAATAPVRLVYASGPLQTFFGAAGLEELSSRMLASEPGKPGFAGLFGQLTPGAPGRLERLRFTFGLRVETVTVLLRRMPAPVSVIIGMVVGARIARPRAGFPLALSALAVPAPAGAPVLSPPVASPQAPAAVGAPAPGQPPAPVRSPAPPLVGDVAATRL